MMEEIAFNPPTGGGMEIGRFCRWEATREGDLPGLKNILDRPIAGRHPDAGDKGRLATIHVENGCGVFNLVPGYRV